MFWPFSSRAARPNLSTNARRGLLQVEALEERAVPAGFFLTGVGGATSPPQPFARVFSTTSGTPTLVGPGNINAFPGFAGEVRVANGDVNRDRVDDIICAQGPGAGSGSRVTIFDGASALRGSVVPISDFFAYTNTAGAGRTPGFAGGVFVASADFNGDGFDEVVTSPGAGARGHVKMFNFSNQLGGFLGSNPTLRASFFAYTDFAGEVRVTTLTRIVGVGPVTFLVTASGAGVSQSDVRLYQNAFNINQVADGVFIPPAQQFFPYPGYAGGVSVAAGDTNADRSDELFVSTNGGIPTVRVFDINQVIVSLSVTPPPSREFVPFPGFNGEVRVGAADVNSDGTVEVLTSTGSVPGAAGSPVKAFNVTGTPIALFSFFASPGYTGGLWLSTNDFLPTRTSFFPTTSVVTFTGGTFGTVLGF
ncbi:MAG: hypothetical protein L0241_03350 [Planctomycetia bacterium]|nr:hypothetical protein [Planctomycetia bacterium]